MGKFKEFDKKNDKIGRQYTEVSYDLTKILYKDRIKQVTKEYSRYQPYPEHKPEPSAKLRALRQKHGFESLPNESLQSQVRRLQYTHLPDAPIIPSQDYSLADTPITFGDQSTAVYLASDPKERLMLLAEDVTTDNTFTSITNPLERTEPQYKQLTPKEYSSSIAYDIYSVFNGKKRSMSSALYRLTDKRQKLQNLSRQPDCNTNQIQNDIKKMTALEKNLASIKNFCNNDDKRRQKIISENNINFNDIIGNIRRDLTEDIICQCQPLDDIAKSISNHPHLKECQPKQASSMINQDLQDKIIPSANPLTITLPNKSDIIIDHTQLKDNHIERLIYMRVTVDTCIKNINLQKKDNYLENAFFYQKVARCFNRVLGEKVPKLYHSAAYVPHRPENTEPPATENEAIKKIIDLLSDRRPGNVQNFSNEIIQMLQNTWQPPN